MTRVTRTGVARGAVVLAVGLSAAPAAAQSRAGGDKPDLAAFLDLAEFYVKPVLPKKDPRTGFVVGGKNATALVRVLTEVNGRSVADLEKDMRPGAASEVGSDSGFLGRDEKLLDVLAADNKTVVDELGLT